MTTKTRAIREFDRATETWRDVIWETRQIPTVDVKVGDIISGPHMWAPVVEVKHLPSGPFYPDGETHIVYAYESWGRVRRTLRRQKTSGKTTVHVRLGPA
jgi:hypothetical protein